MITRSKSLIVVSVLTVCLLFVGLSPAVALAKAKTKTSLSGVAKIYYAPKTQAITGKLLKKSGRKNVAVKSQYVYGYKQVGSKWVSVGKKKTNSKGSFAFTLPTGSNYKFTYKGNKSLKSASVNSRIGYYFLNTWLHNNDAVIPWGSEETTVTGSATTDDGRVWMSGVTLEVQKETDPGVYVPYTTVVTDNEGNYEAVLTGGNYRTVYQGVTHVVSNNTVDYIIIVDSHGRATYIPVLGGHYYTATTYSMPFGVSYEIRY